MKFPAERQLVPLTSAYFGFVFSCFLSPIPDYFYYETYIKIQTQLPLRERDAVYILSLKKIYKNEFNS